MTKRICQYFALSFKGKNLNSTKATDESQIGITQKVLKHLASVVGEYFGKYQGTTFEDDNYLEQNNSVKKSFTF